MRALAPEGIFLLGIRKFRSRNGDVIFGTAEQAAEKAQIFEGYGLQPVRNSC
jgi:hypothetical protein